MPDREEGRLARADFSETDEMSNAYCGYVKFCRRGDGVVWIVTCDSDDEGAFKVWRAGPINAAVSRLVSAERERCAKFCEEMNKPWMASQIRKGATVQWTR